MKLVRLDNQHRRPSRLFVAPDALWFRLPGREPIPLRKRRALRNLLAKLTELRLQSPNEVLPMTKAFEAGWPGERALAKAAATRVYTAIHELRAMGLEGMLVRRHGGYMLDADVYTVSNDSEIPPVSPSEELISIPTSAPLPNLAVG